MKTFDDINDFDDEDYDDDGNEKSESKKFESKTDAYIYLIDARKNMFSSSDQENNFVLCLKGIREAVRTRIFRSEKCICCIALLGTKTTENNLSLSNITVVQELELVGAEIVLKIDKLIKVAEESTYEKEYGFDKFSLADALWLSSHSFMTASKNLNKTVVYFTNDDNPTLIDSHEEKRVTANAQDMYKNFIIFDFIALGKDFEFKKFYKRIVIASKNDANCVIPDPVSSVDEIVERITKTNFKHVNLLKLPFVISKDFQINVSVHFLVKKAKIPYKVKLSKATNERVFTKTEYFEEETGSLVNKDNLIKSQFVGQKDINFSLSELKMIEEVGKKEIKLLGFKPASVLTLENFVKPCAFIYPNDSEYKGSSVFFTALLKRCSAKKVIAICTFCPRTTSSYRFVALIPQEVGNHQLPPGFVVFFLPFAEEIRNVELKPTEKATPEQVEIAEKLIKKLKFSYKPKCFYNPKIKQHWHNIEALALDLKEPEKSNDCTNPNYELMSQRCGDFFKEFIEAVYEEDYDPKMFDNKKKARPKFLKPLSAVNIDSVEDFVRQGKGEQIPNDILKSYLKSAGVTKNLSKIKKADLLEQVRAHLNL